MPVNHSNPNRCGYCGDQLRSYNPNAAYCAKPECNRYQAAQYAYWRNHGQASEEEMDRIALLDPETRRGR